MTIVQAIKHIDKSTVKPRAHGKLSLPIWCDQSLSENIINSIFKKKIRGYNFLEVVYDFFSRLHRSKREVHDFMAGIYFHLFKKIYK